MSDYVLPPPPVPSLAVQGEDARFPLRRVLCVGRNYLDHVREMGNDEREPPFFFMKPADAAFSAGQGDGAAIPFPPDTEDLHHEVELAVALKSGGRDIAAGNALDHVYGYAVAIDLTRRDLQAAAKKAGRPWDWAKGFDLSAPVGPIGPVELATDFEVASAAIRLSVDDVVRQDAGTADMIWSVPEIIAAASRSVELRAGDLILTGTPAGVGRVEPGETLRGQITGLPDVVVRVG